MPSTQDRFRSNQLIFFQCMGYLQARIRLGPGNLLRDSSRVHGLLFIPGGIWAGPSILSKKWDFYTIKRAERMHYSKRWLST
jgi:hypothetical protein